MSESRPTVILIGAARSGTKLVRDMIASHPGVSRVPYDVNYLWRLGNERVPHDELGRELATPRVRRRIRRGIERYRAPGTVLVEKTVATALRVPFAAAVYPEAVFVHLVRNGYDVAESALRQWTAKPDWRYVLSKAVRFPLPDAAGYAIRYGRETVQRVLGRSLPVWGPRYRGIEADLQQSSILTVCALQWRHCVEKAMDALEDVPADRVLTIRYDAFVRDPIAHLMALGSRLRLDHGGYDPAVVRSEVSTNYVGRSHSHAMQEIATVVEPTLQRIQNLRTVVGQ